MVDYIEIGMQELHQKYYFRNGIHSHFEDHNSRNL